MVNVTYDNCESTCYSVNHVNKLTNLLASTLQVTDDQGNEFVYNGGDIAWVLTSTAYVVLTQSLHSADVHALRPTASSG